MTLFWKHHILVLFIQCLRKNEYLNDIMIIIRENLKEIKDLLKEI